MLKNSLNLLKARKDPEKARELAAQMVKEEVQNQADGVIFKFKLVYYALLALPIGFAGLGLYLGLKLHGIFYLITLIALGIFFAMIKARKMAAAQLNNAREAAQSLGDQVPDMLKSKMQTGSDSSPEAGPDNQ